MQHDWNDFIVPLYKDGYNRLFSVAYRRVKDPELAQDLVQDTFLLAIFHQEELIEHPKPNAWLMQTLCNLIMNELRSPSRQDLPLTEEIEVPGKVACNTLDRLLPVQLQDKERKLLIWRFEQQMSYSEMSKQLGISETLCRKWVSLAVNKCRSLLKQ